MSWFGRKTDGEPVDAAAILAFEKAEDDLNKLRLSMVADHKTLQQATKHVHDLEGLVSSINQSHNKSLWKSKLEVLQRELQLATIKTLSLPIPTKNTNQQQQQQEDQEQQQTINDDADIEPPPPEELQGLFENLELTGSNYNPSESGLATTGDDDGVDDKPSLLAMHLQRSREQAAAIAGRKVVRVKRPGRPSPAGGTGMQTQPHRPITFIPSDNESGEDRDYKGPHNKGTSNDSDSSEEIPRRQQYKAPQIQHQQRGRDGGGDGSIPFRRLEISIPELPERSPAGDYRHRPMLSRDSVDSTEARGGMYGNNNAGKDDSSDDDSITSPAYEDNPHPPIGEATIPPSGNGGQLPQIHGVQGGELFKGLTMK